ncbi:hypothetical protein BAU15_05275 [Enterococcus sp. JM4C]|uniref:YopX family protein n=1 Tax=Candidatus Enterococcus huntleyi TaxID=1857217 RepID=UPI00137A725B|nr:YopX family protein [Enterococcus sp. JM4C]KAF1295164.1 hypothetical protein BAU15_05275 [Enterococcus sp. JM4C]
MREIKFRAWDFYEKEVLENVTPLFDELGNMIAIVTDFQIIGSPGTSEIEIGSYDTTLNWDDFPYILMQYTGLKDKNGVEIYEGDIVEASWGSDYPEGYHPISIYRGSVKFGEYEQDGSGGEYRGSPCIGFYGEFVQGADSDREFTNLDSWAYERFQSLLKFDEIKVIGNIYENPELLKESGASE